MKAKVEVSRRRYDRQFQVFSLEYPWLGDIARTLKLELKHLISLTEDVLGQVHMEEPIGLVRHRKRGECSVKVFAISQTGELLGTLYPAHAFTQSFVVLVMRMFGNTKYRTSWVLRDGIRAFIKARQLYVPGARDATDPARHLLVVTEWKVAYQDEVQPCLELRILNVYGNRTLATIEKHTRLRAV